MIRFLSPEWVAALDHAVAADRPLREATADLDLVVEQVVEPVAGGEPVVFHVVFDHGTVRVAAGPAASPTVRFTQDEATARAVASGADSAQRAFMTGRLRLGGDLRAVLENQGAIAALADVFAAVRAETDLGEVPATTGTDGDA